MNDGGVPPRALALRDALRVMAGASIAARMAMALTAVEAAVAKEERSSAELDALLDALWSFVESDDLSQWENRVIDLAQSLRAWARRGAPLPADSAFSPVSDAVRRMLVASIELGVVELYGEIEGDSPATLAALERVLSLAASVGVELPDASRFACSTLDEYGGWGHRRPRAAFGGS